MEDTLKCISIKRTDDSRTCENGDFKQYLVKLSDEKSYIVTSCNCDSECPFNGNLPSIGQEFKTTNSFLLYCFSAVPVRGRSHREKIKRSTYRSINILLILSFIITYSLYSLGNVYIMNSEIDLSNFIIDLLLIVAINMISFLLLSFLRVIGINIIRKIKRIRSGTGH